MRLLAKICAHLSLELLDTLGEEVEADGDNNKVDNSKFSKNFYNFEEDSVRLYQFLDAFQESDKVEIMWADAILILMYV